MAFLTFGTSCTCECGPWHMWKTPVTQVSPRGHMWLKQQIYQLYDVKYWDTSLLQSINHGNHWTSPAEDKECGQFQFHQKFSRSHFLPYLGLHICIQHNFWSLGILTIPMSCLLAVCWSICPQLAVSLLTSVGVWVNTCWACMLSFWIRHVRLNA